MKKYFKLIGILLILIINTTLFSVDRTMGVLKNLDGVYEGYTLFNPASTGNTYLIDNYGRIVHQWESLYAPNLSIYLLENGNLLRSFYTADSDYGVELITWDGDVIWEYYYPDALDYQHHDIEPMPNGNVLLLIRDIRLRADLEDAGRDPSSISTLRLWIEKIVEIEPTGLNTGNVVWEWQIYDHLIQDFDPAKDNYGVVEDHPELMDVNYTPTTLREWLHANGIDYNSELDQISISLRNINEFWIIDHSTTTAEAAGHTGGNSGKGGDILYRWGNPETYRAQTNNEQKFFEQHDARWIQSGYPGEGNITVFNNGTIRPEGLYSSVDEIILPVDEYGNYTVPSTGNSFEPVDQTWVYTDSNPEDMFSPHISGAHRLQNGNTVICQGDDAHFYEVKPDKTIVWEYISPIDVNGAATQGDVVNPLTSFRCHKHSLDYPAFTGKDLTPKGYLEINPITFESTQNLPIKPSELDEVVITSKIYDDAGISLAELHVYFDSDSLIIPMNDSGTEYDSSAGDSIFTAVVPALPGVSSVGYYIKAVKMVGETVTVFNDPPFASQDYSFSYELLSATPVNISITKTSSTTLIEWDPVDGITAYTVYSSIDPYSGFQPDNSGSFNGESWTTDTDETKKFYYVKAVSSK
ncbi:MAG: aryl-sulfate sulfotransferase [Candidatus Delongbacteria bacterium]|nr:aryl-sulfate sulfotransferase [Candidatus Delongbacteria bacterium]